MPYPLCLDVEALDPNDPNILIIDLSRKEIFDQAHLPNAIWVDYTQLQKGIPPYPGKLPELDALTTLLESTGYNGDQWLIAYDDEGGGWAGRFLWTLEVLGIQNYSYLNGGIHAWIAAGRPISTKTNHPEPSTLDLSIKNHDRIEVDGVIEVLGQNGTAIWDARSQAEFLGINVFAARGGHMPGAVNIDWLALMDKNNAYKLKPLSTLKEMLEQKGITADKKVITHCQSHHRSSLSWLVLKILGYPDIAAYDGSWGEWGNLTHTPIE